MTRAELRTLLQSTAHRETDTTVPWDDFIDRAGQRIGRDLRARENTTQVLVSDPYALPADFAETILVEAQISGFWQPLKPAGGHEVSKLQSVQGGNFPFVYWIVGTDLVPGPITTEDVRLTYYTNPVLGQGDTDTNAVLTAFPQLYLAAAMTFETQWEQNEDALGLWTGEYGIEFQAINEARRQQRQPVSTSDYDYSGGTFAV